jgi:hypothetical protein
MAYQKNNKKAGDCPLFPRAFPDWRISSGKKGATPVLKDIQEQL